MPCPTSTGNETPANLQQAWAMSVRSSQSRSRHLTSSGTRRRLPTPEAARLARNISLAEYYQVKKRFVEIKFENILLENEKLRLEIKKLKKGENVSK